MNVCTRSNINIIFASATHDKFTVYKSWQLSPVVSNFPMAYLTNTRCCGFLYCSVSRHS